MRNKFHGNPKGLISRKKCPFESMAILKYIARKHDLLGYETDENFKADMLEVYFFISFKSRI